jgi:hypothetical protein
MSTVDANRVILTGENSVIRLSDRPRASLWNVYCARPGARCCAGPTRSNSVRRKSTNPRKFGFVVQRDPLTGWQARGAALAGRGIPSSCRAGISRGVATQRADQAASAVQAHRGTEGLNPSPSVGESANFQSLSVMTPSLSCSGARPCSP